MIQRAYVDSSVWIALMEGLPATRNLIYRQLEQLEEQWVFYASEIVLMEVLHKPYRESQTELLDVYAVLFEQETLFDNYSALLADGLQIVQSESLKALDAMHLAIARHYGCELFITTDKHFLNTSIIPVLWIDLTTAD